MSKLTLHRLPSDLHEVRMHLVGDTGLIVRFDESGCWHIYYTKWYEPSESDWWTRNQQISELKFNSLRAAREYLEALFAVDPPPRKQHLTRSDLKMERKGPGLYEALTPKGCRYTVRGRRGEWNICEHGTHHILIEETSLYMVRDWLASW